MQTHKKRKARILSLVLSAAMVTTMMPATVFAAEGDSITPGASWVGTIQSFDKLEDRYIPSVGENAPSHIYGLSVALNTPVEELNLPSELTAMVARTVTAPAEDESVVDSGNQLASPSDAKEEVKEEIKDEGVPLAPERSDKETVTTTVESESIPVTWKGDKEYRSDENGRFIYTTVLPAGYSIDDGVQLPQIYVYVGRQARAGGDVITVNGTSPYTLDGAGLQQAFTDIADNGTITIGGNIAANVSITLDTEKSVTLDLAGKTVTITGNKRSGFDMQKTNLTIKDSSTGGKLAVTAASVADSSPDFYSAGIYCKNLTVQSGDVAATSGTGNQSVLGIRAIEGVAINGGTVTAVARDGNNNSTGVLAQRKIAISAGTVNATAGNANTSYGLAAQLSKNSTEIEITGGTVTATAGEAVAQSYGIQSVGSLTISGTSTIVNATGKTVSNSSSGGSVGIYSSGVSGQSTALNISGGTIKATGSAGGVSFGINFNGHTATISGGTVTATGAAGSTISAGLAGGISSPLTITGGTVTATGVANGVNTSSAFSVSGTSTVFAKGGTAAISSSGTLTLTDREVKYKIGNDFIGETNVANNKIYEGATGTTTEAKDLRMIKKPLVLSGITVSGTHKTAYKYGETFDKTNMIVTANYSNGTNAAVTNYTFSPTTALAMSDSKVVVSYTENGVTKTADVAITMSKADATEAMKTVATNVSKDGKAGATVSLPTKPAGATYGTPTASGTINMTAMSVSEDTLTYTAPASTTGQTGVITIPVTTATNYNDYSITVTITSVDKTPVTVTGLTAATGLIYNGSTQNGYTGTISVEDNKVPVSELVYTYTSTDSGTYNSSTAPTNAGAYKLVVSVADSNANYTGTHADILFTIGKATVTITADNKSAYVGDAKPALTYTATGKASSDTLTTEPTLEYESEPDMSKAGSIKIKAKDAVVPNTDNYESAITYVDGTLTINAKSSGGGGGGGSSSGDSSGSSGSNVTVDGKTESIGKTENTGSTTTVVVDSSKLDSKVSSAKDGSSVVVPVSTTKDSAAAQLVVESVEKMAAKNMTLEVKAGKTTYSLPAAAIDTNSVLAQLGVTDASKVPFTVTITNEKNVKVEGATLVVPPVSFTVTATYNGKSITVDSFDAMVARTMAITKDQASKITTAVVVEKDGTLRHVPTAVYEQGGKWYAKVNSMTNSTYALITNESKFTDVTGKWYEAAANELSAREVTDGVFGTTFEGEKNITRAEFAALLVNAFGLPKTNKADFSDVSADAWYSQAVATAVEYGIVKGIGDGKFAPDNTITRQEAMVMIQRAANIVGYTGGGTDNGTFTDRNLVGTWAADGVAFNLANGLIVGNDGKINPTGTITRAETVTVLLRLLQKAELVDVRTAVLSK